MIYELPLERRTLHGHFSCDLEHRFEVAREVPVQRAPLERELVDHGSSERTAAATRSGDGM